MTLETFLDLDLSYGTATATARWVKATGDGYYEPYEPAHWELDTCTGVWNDTKGSLAGTPFSYDDLLQEEVEELENLLQAEGDARRLDHISNR